MKTSFLKTLVFKLRNLRKTISEVNNKKPFKKDDLDRFHKLLLKFI